MRSSTPSTVPYIEPINKRPTKKVRGIQKITFLSRWCFSLKSGIWLMIGPSTWQNRERRKSKHTKACGWSLTKSFKTSSICWLEPTVLKSLVELPSCFRIPSIRNPRLAVDEMVSRHTMYLGLVTPPDRSSSGVGAFGSTCSIFSNISFTNNSSKKEKERRDRTFKVAV